MDYEDFDCCEFLKNSTMRYKSTLDRFVEKYSNMEDKGSIDFSKGTATGIDHLKKRKPRMFGSMTNYEMPNEDQKRIQDHILAASWRKGRQRARKIRRNLNKKRKQHTKGKKVHKKKVEVAEIGESDSEVEVTEFEDPSDNNEFEEGEAEIVNKKNYKMKRKEADAKTNGEYFEDQNSSEGSEPEKHEENNKGIKNYFNLKNHSKKYIAEASCLKTGEQLGDKSKRTSPIKKRPLILETSTDTDVSDTFSSPEYTSEHTRGKSKRTFPIKKIPLILETSTDTDVSDTFSSPGYTSEQTRGKSKRTSLLKFSSSSYLSDIFPTSEPSSRQTKNKFKRKSKSKKEYLNSKISIRTDVSDRFSSPESTSDQTSSKFKKTSISKKKDQSSKTSHCSDISGTFSSSQSTSEKTRGEFKRTSVSKNNQLSLKKPDGTDINGLLSPATNGQTKGESKRASISKNNKLSSKRSRVSIISDGCNRVLMSKNNRPSSKNCDISKTFSSSKSANELTRGKSERKYLSKNNHRSSKNSKINGTFSPSQSTSELTMDKSERTYLSQHNHPSSKDVVVWCGTDVSGRFFSSKSSSEQTRGESKRASISKNNHLCSLISIPDQKLENRKKYCKFDPNCETPKKLLTMQGRQLHFESQTSNIIGDKIRVINENRSAKVLQSFEERQTLDKDSSKQAESQKLIAVNHTSSTNDKTISLAECQFGNQLECHSFDKTKTSNSVELNDSPSNDIRICKNTKKRSRIVACHSEKGKGNVKPFKKIKFDKVTRPKVYGKSLVSEICDTNIDVLISPTVPFGIDKLFTYTPTRC